MKRIARYALFGQTVKLNAADAANAVGHPIWGKGVQTKRIELTGKHEGHTIEFSKDGLWVDGNDISHKIESDSLKGYTRGVQFQNGKIYTDGKEITAIIEEAIAPKKSGPSF